MLLTPAEAEEPRLEIYSQCRVPYVSSAHLLAVERVQGTPNR